MSSDLGINPTNDGNVIRLAFPPLTEERRKELVKVVRHKAEEGKVAVRNLRRAGRHELEALQKDGELSDRRARAGREGAREDHPRAGERRSTSCSRTKSKSCCRSEERQHMADDTDDFDEFDTSGLDGIGDPGTEPIDEDPPTYHSGRVRIIGAEPAGDTVHEVTGPVVDEHPELPHWNDAPTGQVPAVLDTQHRRRAALAPPTWREEDTDWEAQEEIFEPSMLSDDLPAVGALLGEQRDELSTWSASRGTSSPTTRW